MKTSKLEVGIISLFPRMFDSLCYGIPGRALKGGCLKLHHFNPRDYGERENGYVDDRPYGGGPGMVMSVQPLRDTLRDAKTTMGNSPLTVYLSPQGKVVDQALLNDIASTPQPLLLLCGRYEGIDERLLAHEIDEQWSLGDMVLSGGELPAMAIVDGLSRLLPGVLGSDASSAEDSFMDGLLDHPHYTRPECIDGLEVPKVLLSGDHKAIARWRKKQAIGQTWLKRPDLLKKRPLDDSEKQLLREFRLELNQE